ncbi:cytochrome P450 2K1 [Oryzias melastigma]|uniref:Cytochrome P450 2K1-like n=1 Tax=Oryzias melastigma TaxID=30732 RepID=A0A3B3DAL8_ORYME|nr:cytochrome P450 2K1 [Oryzias melastigma]
MGLSDHSGNANIPEILAVLWEYFFKKAQLPCKRVCFFNLRMLDDLLSLSLFWIIVGLLVFSFFHGRFRVLENVEPPGPRPLLFLGNLLQLDLKRLDKSLCDLSKKYGPVFQIYFGPKKVVVLAGYRTVKQALVNHAVEFGNREVTPIFYDFNKGHGILFANGDSWREMRRFSLTTLKDFGMGKRLSEEKIIEECYYLIEEFERFKGKPFINSQAIHYAVSNVMSAVTFGKRFEYTDPVFQAMVDRDNESIHLAGTASVMIYNLLPWLGPYLKNWRDLMKNIEDGKSDIGKIIADLKNTLDPNLCRCFVDAFLIRKQNLEESKINSSLYNDNNLLYSVMNLFGAGNDTTGNTLKWCLLYMAKHPCVQEQVQDELKRVVGSRQVRVEDRKNLPFTDAVIHESQRLANIGPMALPHATSQDVTFQGYFIKKGTTVIPLLTSVLYDESEWESPYSFNPSHFLDKEGKFIKRDAFLAFSAGRRACLGESLARMELFLFFTSLLQHFTFTPPPGVSEDELDLTPVVGVTLCPQPQKLCAVRRQ